MVPIQRVLQEITGTELIRVHIGPCYGLSLTSTPHLLQIYTCTYCLDWFLCLSSSLLLGLYHYEVWKFNLPRMNQAY
jgi:hypothetical protein